MNKSLVKHISPARWGGAKTPLPAGCFTEYQIEGKDNNSAVCYQYDRDGRITRVGRIQACQTISATTPVDCTSTGVEKTDYSYDTKGRLTTATEATGHKTLFQYDPFGNRTHETITNTTNPGATGGAPKAYGTYRYGYDGNRLQTLYYTPPAGVEAVQEQFTYDNAGRIKTRNHSTHGLTTYSWDDRGYLIKLEKPGTTISYSYNALGARTSKSVNGVTTRYVTAPIFGMNHVLMELDGNNTVTARYVNGGHEQLIAEPSPGNSANDQYLLHGGTVGNVTHAVSRSGTVQTESSYDAFGNRTLVSGSSATRFGYAGEESDAESGLLYLRARYYDPAIGRFVSVDPYLGRLAEPATQNRYVYVQNNPVMLTDPRGYDAIGIAYVGYPIEVPKTQVNVPFYGDIQVGGFELPLGHAAVIPVDPKTGSTRYYEYGRYGGDFGKVERRPVPDLVIGPDGRPTDESLKRLYSTVSEKYGEGYPVSATYYSDADYNKVVGYAESVKGNNDRPAYSWNPLGENDVNTCYTFRNNAIEAGRR